MRLPLLAFPAMLLPWALSCGGNRPPAPPAIVVQPSDQTVAVGEAWSFSVSAAGTEPLNYQWTWNGTPLLYGTGPTIQVAPSVAADNGSRFQVTVTNAAGSATSTAAALTVAQAPRAPVKGDLRFKDVDAFPFTIQGLGALAFSTGFERIQHNALGSPLAIGGSVPATPDATPYWSWGAGFFALPVGVPSRDFGVMGSWLANLSTDLEPLLGPKTVITSLDIPGAEGSYGLAWATTTFPGNYTCIQNTVAPSAFPALVAQEGAAGRVITALTFYAGQVYAFSYGWDGDPGTVYETQVAAAAAGQVCAQAADLSARGYILTALGGNDTSGYLLVGTRVQGDTLPRPFQLCSGQAPLRGYAMVGWYLDTTPGPGSGNEIWIYQQ